MKTETLKDTFPKDFMSGEYDNCPAFKFADMAVVKTHSLLYDQNDFKPWPGKHKFVYTWVELENGSIVGWNENPSRGWSFPIMKKPKFY